MSKQILCDSCSDTQCKSKNKKEGEKEEDYRERMLLASRLCRIKHKIMVLSGKGGVGKSTVAANLSVALARRGKKVGLMDIDIHGPSIPAMLGISDKRPEGSLDGIFPVKVDLPEFSGELYVMSIGLLLPNRDDAVIWRGPMKFGAIRQFIRDVEWGDLDYLVVDSPPGTGDEPLTVAQLIENADGAVVVTTPQEISLQDVRKCIVFCRQVKLPVLGVIENMSGFICPKCGEKVDIFGRDGGNRMAEQMGVPFLGSVPIETEVVSSGDRGVPIIVGNSKSKVAIAFEEITNKLIGKT